MIKDFSQRVLLLVADNNRMKAVCPDVLFIFANCPSTSHDQYLVWQRQKALYMRLSPICDRHNQHF
jgi:hypothetical protein